MIAIRPFREDSKLFYIWPTQQYFEFVGGYLGPLFAVSVFFVVSAVGVPEWNALVLSRLGHTQECAVGILWD